MYSTDRFDPAAQAEALKNLPAYEFTGSREIPELKAVGVTLSHKKTGARVFLLLCDDVNKVFTIGFRTPSRDSTGVAHIVEHTVLCGSEKYPAKDPFVELAKGSLNTFLNAMTYPDKTIYPVASCNDQDFRNLMDVYLDAVFHPNLLKEEKIFRQEGWHYEAESTEGPLTLNGVVYNEMKGVYSSPDGVLERAVNELLFPGHPYAEESGGDPEVIPELTYESYKDFYETYYHPSNAFIYLYGRTDMVAQLRYIDEEYLCRYDRRPVDSELKDPAPLPGPARRVVEYSVSETEPEENAAYFSWNLRVGGELDPLLANAWQALEYVLLTVPGAPLHDALIQAGIGEDVYGGYSFGIREPYFAVTAKNVSLDQEADFRRVVRETLEKLADGELSHEMLLAAINVAEFRAREADFGPYPKGLMYGIESFSSWLYDADPCMHLSFDSMFQELRQKVEEHYFEDLIREMLLQNESEVLVVLKPVRGLTATRDKAQREQLDAYFSALPEEERQRIVRETAELKAYQSEGSTKEALETIPLLKREDLGKEITPLSFKEMQVAGARTVWSELYTTGISYLRLNFDITGLPQEDLSHLAILRDVLTYLDTEQHSYADLSTAINLNSGGVAFGADFYPDFSPEGGHPAAVFQASGKVMADKTGFLLDILRELLTETRFEDTNRLSEVLSEVRAGLKDRLTQAGHTAAAARAAAGLLESAAFTDATRGIAYFRLLERYAAAGPEALTALAGKLRDLSRRLFTADNLVIHLTGSSEEMDALRGALEETGFLSALPATGERPEAAAFEPDIRREAFATASRVNYVARAGSYVPHGYAYTGALRVLKVLLSYDYLWNRIRVLGGAYGCMASFGRGGSCTFVSYRDPKLLETDAVYDGIPAYAESYTAGEREMTKAVIGAVSELDSPLTPQNRGLRGLSAWYSHVTDEMLKKEREQVLTCTQEEIRALAPLLRAALSDGARCAIGNEEQIRKNAEFFTSVEPLASGEAAEAEDDGYPED